MMMQPTNPAPICTTRVPGRMPARRARASSRVQQVLHARKVDAGDLLAARPGARRDEEAVVRNSVPVADVDDPGGRVHRPGASRNEVDPHPPVVVLVLADEGPRLVDVALEEIRDRHPGVRRLPLAAEEGDLGGRIGLAQGLRRDHAGGTASDDDVPHARPRRSRFRRRAARCVVRCASGRPPPSSPSPRSTPAASRRASRRRPSAGRSSPPPSSGAAAGSRPSS